MLINCGGEELWGEDAERSAKRDSKGRSKNKSRRGGERL